MADAIVAVSEGVADELARHTGLPREQIVTIHNAVVSESVLAKSAAPVPHPWFAPDDPRWFLVSVASPSRRISHRSGRSREYERHHLSGW